MSSVLKNMLKSKVVLYSTVVVFLVNIVALMISKKFVSVILFCLTSFAINYYNKNMIVVLLGSLLVANLYVIISALFGKKEGMTENKRKSKDNKHNTVSKNSIDTKVKKSDNSKKCVGANCKKNKTGTGAGQSTLTPASTEGFEDDDDEEDTKVDYASTLENAYSNLNKLLNSDAINSMTKDTQRLAKNQEALMGNINKLEPMMQKAGAMLNGLDLSNIDGMLAGLSGKLEGKMGGKM